MKWLLLPLLLLSLNKLSAQGAFKLYGNIYNKNKEAISNVQFHVFEGAKKISSSESSLNGSFGISFEFHKEFIVDIVREGYLTKRVIVNTRVPIHADEINYDLFTLIILDIKETGKETSGVPVSKYYFNELIGGFTGEKFKDDITIKNNNEQLLAQKALLKHKELLEEAEQLVKEANIIKLQAKQYADSLRREEYEKWLLAKNQDPEVSNNIIRQALENSTKEPTEKDFLKLDVDKGEFENSEKVKELKHRINEISNVEPKTYSDSLNLKKERLSLRREFFELAKYQFEVDRLKAITKEDSLRIEQRESELFYMQQEMILAEKEIETANKEIKLKELEISKKNMILITFVVGSILLLIFLAIVFYFYKDKKRVNKLLEYQNLELEKLSVVARETSNAIIIADKKGKFDWVNKAYSELFGYNIEEVTGDKAKSLISDKVDTAINQLVKGALSDGKAINYEFETESKSGEKIWLQSTLTPILDDKNKISKVVVVDSDITKVKRAEQEIRSQNEHISMQNSKIISSITYAKTIQSAILSPIEELSWSFKSFLIFRPKDIVSGDFYWHTYLPPKNGRKGKHIYAVVDCTGHGVPGAFMSMIGSRLLNEIVREREIDKPSEILALMNTMVIRALRQRESDNNDGMDVSLCSLESPEEGPVKITYAGAKRPLYIYHNQDKRIEVIKGTRKSIGGKQGTKNKEVFIDQHLTLNKNDVVYLTSDGYADQPSPERKKMGSSSLIKLLNKIGSEKTSRQKQLIESQLDDFQGDAEQRDDITVLGIKV